MPTQKSTMKTNVNIIKPKKFQQYGRNHSSNPSLYVTYSEIIKWLIYVDGVIFSLSYANQCYYKVENELAYVNHFINVAEVMGHISKPWLTMVDIVSLWLKSVDEG